MMKSAELKKKNVGRCVALVALVATLASASAYALRDRAYDIVYYSDASKTEEVGRLMFPCDYGSAMEGVKTPFYETEVTVENCNDGMPDWPYIPWFPTPP